VQLRMGGGDTELDRLFPGRRERPTRGASHRILQEALERTEKKAGVFKIGKKSEMNLEDFVQEREGVRGVRSVGLSPP